MTPVPPTDKVKLFSSASEPYDVKVSSKVTAPDNLLYEYAVIRYVPRVEREEFINVGLLMMCKRRRWLRCDIYLDSERLKAFDPRVNIERLRHQLQLFERSGVPFPDSPVEERYRWLVAAKSACLQTSPSHPGIAYMPFEASLVSPEALLASEAVATSTISYAEASPISSPDSTSILNSTFERLFTELVN